MIRLYKYNQKYAKCVLLSKKNADLKSSIKKHIIFMPYRYQPNQAPWNEIFFKPSGRLLGELTHSDILAMLERLSSGLVDPAYVISLRPVIKKYLP